MKQSLIKANPERLQIGKWVQVISNASYLHYRKFGRVVGFTKNGMMAFVHFEGESHNIQFYKSSLYVLN